MSGTAMLAVEGVLMESEDFDITSQPSATGRGLYAALQSVYRLVLVTSETSPERANHWLRSNYFADFDNLLTSPDSSKIEKIDIRVAQLRAMRASRTAMAIVVDCDPLVITHAMSVGVPGLLYGPPRPAPGRLDLRVRKIRDWSSIEAEYEVHRELRMKETTE